MNAKSNNPYGLTAASSIVDIREALLAEVPADMWEWAVNEVEWGKEAAEVRRCLKNGEPHYSRSNLVKALGNCTAWYALGLGTPQPPSSPAHNSGF